MSRLLRTSLVALVIPLASISAHAQPLITAFAGNETLEGCHNHNNVVATSTCLEFIIGLGIDGSGNLLIAAGHGAAVYRVDQSGVVTLLANGPECCSAFDVAADLSGKVLVTAAHHIYRLDPSGVIASVLSGYDLAGLASDGEGNLFASDKNTDTVLRIDAQGAVAVYPGNGRHGSSGDGGLATAAKFNAPRRLAVDADGKLYIGDFFNQRVRKVDPMGSLWFKERVGCQITGQVKLAAPAPPAGLTVFLASDHGNLLVTPQVTVPPGKVSKKFPVTVSPQLTYEIGRVTANFGSFTRTTAFAVGPPRPLKVTFDPPTATPGSTVTGIVTMNCPAAFDDVNVVITAALSNWDGSYPPAATVPQGSSTATFAVITELVGRPKAPVRFTATANTGAAVGILTATQQ